MFEPEALAIIGFALFILGVSVVIAVGNRGSPAGVLRDVPGGLPIADDVGNASVTTPTILLRPLWCHGLAMAEQFVFPPRTKGRHDLAVLLPGDPFGAERDLETTLVHLGETMHLVDRLWATTDAEVTCTVLVDGDAQRLVRLSVGATERVLTNVGKALADNGREAGVFLHGVRDPAGALTWAARAGDERIELHGDLAEGASILGIERGLAIPVPPVFDDVPDGHRREWYRLLGALLVQMLAEQAKGSRIAPVPAEHHAATVTAALRLVKVWPSTQSVGLAASSVVQAKRCGKLADREEAAAVAWLAAAEEGSLAATLAPQVLFELGRPAESERARKIALREATGATRDWLAALAPK